MNRFMPEKLYNSYNSSEDQTHHCRTFRTAERHESVKVLLLLKAKAAVRNLLEAVAYIHSHGIMHRLGQEDWTYWVKHD